MEIALRQQVAFQKVILEAAHLAGGLLHPSHLLKMEQPLILLYVEIA